MESGVNKAKDGCRSAEEFQSSVFVRQEGTGSKGAWEKVNTHVPAQVLEAVRILVLRQIARLYQGEKEEEREVGDR